MNRRRNILDLSTLTVMLLDVLIFLFTPAFALWLRYDFMYSSIPSEYISGLPLVALVYAVLSLVCFFLFKNYHYVWHFISIAALYRIIPATVISSLLLVGVSTAFSCRLPSAVYVISFFLELMLVSGMRFSLRAVRYIRSQFQGSRARVNTMIIGAGEAGRLLIHEIRTSPKISDANVVCVIDDLATKHGKLLDGVPIVGDRSCIKKAVEEYHVSRIIYAIPSSTPQLKRDILEICRDTGCELKTVPGIYQFVNGDVSVSALRDVSLVDLLGREPIEVDSQSILKLHRGKTVMVTGGGGSIGSELCRQIASHNPSVLVLVDIYENNAYDLQQELLRSCPKLDLRVRVASVRDEVRMDQIFDEFRPDIVYHAAAHKHVPLMEDSPGEAVKNNVFGTLAVAKCAAKYGVKRFVLISTDKAVNPTSVMGATKRICEMIIQYFSRHSDTDFVAVRFGNVLGSNGSVVPLFKKQIAEGGPVTVTHREITRFFMTISEAVSLVLQACTYAEGGEIFVFDMGSPVKIADLAKNLIRLSGYVPDVDIPIVYTGLRPGEKLYEEILLDEEGLEQTANKLIYIAKPINMDDTVFEKQLEELRELCVNSPDMVEAKISEIVPTYAKPDNNGSMSIVGVEQG